MDGFGRPQSLVGDEFAFDAFGLRAFEIQIAEPTQRFRTQAGIAGVQIQKAAVAVHRLVRIDALRRCRAHVDLIRLEILDGRRRLRGRIRGRRREGKGGR